MSSFSNPTSQAKMNSLQYVDDLLALLGQDDPLEVMNQLLPALEKATRGISAEDLRRPEKPGKWSIMQVLHHLVDTEMVYGYRVRMIVSQVEPPLASYDQDLWAAALRYSDGTPPELLEELRVMRGRNMRLLKALRPEELKRVGHHEERGPESVTRVMQMIAGHDRVHLRQVERIKRAHGLA
jgi:hypothetical protein